MPSVTVTIVYVPSFGEDSYILTDLVIDSSSIPNFTVALSNLVCPAPISVKIPSVACFTTASSTTAVYENVYPGFVINAVYGLAVIVAL